MDRPKTERDLLLTSTGRAHFYKPVPNFPSAKYTRHAVAPLPPLTLGDDEVPPSEHFVSTTASTYTPQRLDGVYHKDDKQGQHEIPSGRDDTRNIVDMLNRTASRRRPLDMANRTSEMKSQYVPKVGASDNDLIELAGGPFRNYIMRTYHGGGKKMDIFPGLSVPTSSSKVIPRDGGVFQVYEPLVSTTHLAHRPFSIQEYKNLPIANQATHQMTAENSRIRGNRANPLPADSVAAESGAMRDTSTSAVRECAPVQNIKTVPHTGMRSQYMDSFGSAAGQAVNFHPMTPVERPYTITEPSETAIMSIPGMYETMYGTMTNNRPVMV